MIFSNPNLISSGFTLFLFLLRSRDEGATATKPQPCKAKRPTTLMPSFNSNSFFASKQSLLRWSKTIHPTKMWAWVLQRSCKDPRAASSKPSGGRKKQQLAETMRRHHCRVEDAVRKMVVESYSRCCFVGLSSWTPNFSSRTRWLPKMWLRF